MGWAVPTSLLQEGDVLQVEFSDSAPRQGLPSCATRTFIDLTTDGGKVRASLVLAAYAAQHEVYAKINDGLTTCRFASSVENTWIRIRP